ncbi:MAG: ABC transporter permease subunit [Planctomycetota bacterium]
MMALPLANLTLWVTPLWLLGLGVSIGVAVLLVVYGVLWLVRPETGRSITRLVQEGVLAPISYVVLTLVAIVLVAGPVSTTDRITESLGRLWSVDDYQTTLELPPRTEDFEHGVSFLADELVRYEIESDQDIRVAGEAGAAYSNPAAVVLGDEPYEWTLRAKRPRGFQGEVESLYLTNEGDAAATVSLRFKTDVRVPEVHQLPVIAASVIAVYLIYVLLHWLAPNVSNIAIATAKEACAQPLFLLFLGLGATALIVYIVIPYNTFGEDVKMLKDSGLNTVMVLAIVFALWTASVSVAEEIEGKTALTLLSKPISRRQFILGKYVGILWSVAVLFVVLGAILLATISFKVVYDARETSNPTPDWQECYGEMIQVVPGLVLAFLETAALAAVSVAISTRLPMLPNLLICGSMYVVGNLTPKIAQSAVGENPFVQFFARFLGLLLPVLDHFNIQATIAAGLPVPFSYLAWATLYCIVYCAFAMLLALLLFEDRDLA